MKRASRYSRGERGLALIELMIALALGLTISVAVIQLFISSKNIYRSQDAMSRVQENGRYAVESLARELRMAGYIGCGNIERIQVNVIADPPPAFMAIQADNFIRGTNSVTPSNGFGAKTGTDTVTIRRASGDGVRLAGNLGVSNANIQLVSNAFGFKADDSLMITDCVAADVFNAVNVSGSNNPSVDKKVTIAHSSSGNNGNRLSKLYGSDAEVMLFQSLSYFVRPSGRTTSGGRSVDSLWVRVQNNAATSTTPIDVEVVEGVENLQIEYGIDTTGNRAVNEYRTANNVNDWSRVIAVRFSLLMASPEDNVVARTGDFSQSVTFDGGSVGGDGVLRDVFESVVTIRNRVP